LLESVGPNLFLTGLASLPSQLKDAIAFIVLVLILIFAQPASWVNESRRIRPKEHDMNSESSIWKKAVQTGLIGGVISLLLGVVEWLRLSIRPI